MAALSDRSELDTSKVPYQLPQPTGMMPDIFLGGALDLDGAVLDYEGLKGYFASLRAAFDGLSIGRGSWSSSVTPSRVRRRSQGPSLR